MHAIILCPGPSLARSAVGRHRGGPVVAVNRAARLGCDWWAAGDPWPIREEAATVRGIPSLFTTLAAARQLAADDPVALRRVGRGRLVRFDHLYAWLPPRTCRWPAFTATAALVLCGWLGADRVTVFGADRAADAPDWDGRQDSAALRDAEPVGG
jgi:hypothetical protein